MPGSGLERDWALSMGLATALQTFFVVDHVGTWVNRKRFSWVSGQVVASEDLDHSCPLVVDFSLGAQVKWRLPGQDGPGSLGGAHLKLIFCGQAQRVFLSWSLMDWSGTFSAGGRSGAVSWFAAALTFCRR